MTTTSHLRRAVATLTAAAAVVAAVPVLATGAAVPAAAAPAAAAPTTTTPRPAAARPTTTAARPTTTSPASRPSPPPTVAGARAAADRQVDVLRSSRAEVRSELDEISRRIDAEAAALAAVRAEVERAGLVELAAAQRVAQARAVATVARDQVRDYAVRAFIRPPAQDSLAVLSVGRAEDAAYARDVLGIMADERRGVVEQLVAAEQVAAGEEATARDAAAAARTREAEVAGQIAELERLRDEQATLAEQLDDRLDAALSEAAALAAVDARAAADLAARETALRSQGPATPPGRTAPAPRTAAPATPGRPAAPTPRPTPAPAPGRPAPAPAPTTTTRPPAPRPPSRPPTGTVGWTDVTRVGGIWVHTSIAGQVRGLLDAATAAGFSLSGGGYRDPAEQITLRRAHCGPTDYDIYSKPASQCTPPTARPGASMHERGLAVDFLSGGRLITSRADPAFRWLQANASRYGFFNLPSEPWHWSVNGQ